MNRKGVKAISGVLCASMLMGNVTPVFAATTDTQTTSNETDTKEVEVTYDKSASYFVTIPKTITLDSNKESTYNVKVEGDIPSDRNVYVAPQDAILQTDTIDFYMYDQSTKNPKEDVVAIVTYNKDTWDFEDVANGVEETNNKISASQLTAGNWKGTFNFNINMKGAHKHTYTSEVTKEPTCTEAGVKTFTCVDGDHSYTEEISATGHKYGTPTYTWSSDKSTCIAKRVCANDASHVETETVNATSVITKAATCDEAGTKTYTATFENSAFAKQTSTSSIPATGHKYSLSTEVKATCKSDGYQIYRCNCGNNYKEILKAKNVEHVDMNGDKICDNCKENLSSGLFKLNSDECEYSWNELGKTGFIVDSGNSFRWSKSGYYNYNLVIPSHITSMGAGNLSKLSISQVTLDGCSLGGGAFAGSSISTLRIGKEASLSSSSLNVGNNITKIILDEGRTTITEGMLNGCTKITNIEIPNSVTNIEEYAFKNCSSLTTLTLPDNIKVLESYAFDGCTSLTSITYKGTTYTNKTKLTNALTSNGVNVGYFPFNSTKLQ